MLRAGLVALGIAVLATVAAHGCGPTTFECTQSSQCSVDGMGACQPDGWCSFPDADCASGQRYGEFAGDGQADACVPSDGELSSSGSTAATTNAATTTDEGDATSSVTTTTPPDPATVGPTGEVDSTTMTTMPSVCGNGVIELDEDCDDGNSDPSDACTTECRISACGDGFVQTNVESCDPGVPLGVPCSDYGAGDGAVECTDECAPTLFFCDGCAGDCGTFSGCSGPQQCGTAEACVTLGDAPIGTCLPPCNFLSCPNGQICLEQITSCALACESDADCPAGKSCGTGFGLSFCVW